MRVVVVAVLGAWMVLGSGWAARAQTATYDAVRDFKTNGLATPWSYTDGIDGRFCCSTHSLYGQNGWRAQTNGSTGTPAFAYVAKNTTGATLTYGTVVAPPHALAVIPGNQHDGIEAMFTAPVDGEYRAKIRATGNQTSEESHPIDVFTGNHVLCVGSIAQYGQALECDRTVVLKARQQIIFLDSPSPTGDGNVGVSLSFNVKGPVIKN